MGSKVKQYIRPRHLNIFTLKRFGNLLISIVLGFGYPHVHASLHFRAREFRDNGMSPQLGVLARFARWVAYWTFIDHFTASSHTAVFL